MSNIGKALEKIVNPGAAESFEITDSRVDNTSHQRRFEYEDGVITRNVEASYQIQRMQQPFVFTTKELDERHFIQQGDSNADSLLKLRDIRNKITLHNQTLGATVLVTSVCNDPEAGVLARNLAAILASDDTRTSLLVECSTSRYQLHNVNDSIANGITDYVTGNELTVEDIVLPTGIPRMRVIPYGTGKGVSNFDYFRSTRLRVLIKDISRRYPRERFTVLDAPSISDVPDVELLTEYADFILLTVPYGKVSDIRLKKALSSLESSKLLGVLLTGAPRVPDSMVNFVSS